MTNRNSLLGRSRPTERLTKDEKAALDRATTAPAPAPPAPTAPAPAPPAPPTPTPAPANPPQNKTIAKQTKVRKDQLKFHWTVECPECGFKVSGGGEPQPGQRMARCGRCKVHLFLAGK